MITENNPLSQFAKKRVVTNKPTTSNAIIYTRVSTKEQADNNMSLLTQIKACEQYGQKAQLTVLGCFGGTYESAQTDERKEFKRMLDFAHKSKEKVSYILVYSLDRFSRTGANGAYIASLLRKEGVVIQAITQQTDASTSGGKFQQNMYFMFSEYDNDLRREKCTAGTKERLLQGYWVTRPPFGYDSVVINGEKMIVVNEKGKLLRKAFMWKANDGLASIEIIKKLASLGLQLTDKRMSEIFRNPFYCGFLAHNLLDGELIEGRQEKLISKEVFLGANYALKVKRKEFKQKPLNDSLPLKHFFRCDTCGNYLRGYIVKKKLIYYYKCANGKCSCNKSAKELHARFTDTLNHYTIDEGSIPALQERMEAIFEEANQSHAEEFAFLEERYNGVTRKIERLEERFMEEEIDKAFFEKFSSKLKEEKRQMEAEMDKQPLKKSNLNKYIDFALSTACNLSSLWENGDYEMKQKLQFMLFPEGIYYNKKNDESRTGRVNSVFELLCSLSGDLAGQKKGEISMIKNLPDSVPGVGVELYVFVFFLFILKYLIYNILI